MSKHLPDWPELDTVLPIPVKGDDRAMDFAKALAELREQRDCLDQAILSLERFASGRPRGRGRPPGRTAGPSKKRPAIRAHASEDQAKAALD